MPLTNQQIAGYLALLSDDIPWAVKRRTAILYFWPDADVRAAEQDARNGKPEALAAYDADVAAIKLMVPKP